MQKRVVGDLVTKLVNNCVQSQEVLRNVNEQHILFEYESRTKKIKEKLLLLLIIKKKCTS